MKKILVTAFLLMFCIVPIGLFAENDAVDKGSFEFGLGTAFNLTLYFGNIEANEFSIGSGWTRVNVGYFIVDRFYIGGAASYYSWKDRGATDASTQFFFGPEMKYYIVTSERVLFNLKGVLRILSWKEPWYTDSSSRVWFGGGCAVTYLITNNLGTYVGVDIFYSPNFKSEGVETIGTNYGIGDVLLGFSVYL